MVVVMGGFRDCVTGFVSTFKLSVRFSLLALRALFSVDDLPASRRRREPSEERTNLHHIDFDGIFFSVNYKRGKEVLIPLKKFTLR
jgi:hypothetical protein